ncbi:hypothetical protein KOR34_26900 [Posidoniimonas corsicana]|uniref:HEAT repeat protein n=1 Tax=Posidoniimonas corsicana TaxID=1938618 RepID=A0A5C5VI97_9BACT|nr:HEAT repeat domain-containing protein [Posidoniimonas corsicana]TWT37727.1 hypothetical protein KOR34_26900 [Posidoniimonas corsicana]
MLALGVVVVLGGWSISRRYVAGGITARAMKNPATSRSAISELAQLGDSALSALLDAAVSDDREVAIPARAELEAMLARWAAGRPASFESRCSRVIRGVTHREPLLTPSGRVWARRLGDQALRLIDPHQAGEDSGLLSDVERLFAVSQQTSQYPDQPLRARSIRTVRVSPPRRAPASVAASPNPPVQQAPLAAPAEGSVAAPPLTAAAPAPQLDSPLPAAEPIPSEPTAVATGPASLDWRPPAQAAGEPTEPRRLVQSDTTPDASTVPASPTQPGLSAEVIALLEGDDRDKLQLVEQLLRGEHENAAAILLRLAKDPAPRVRLSAISALGSSPNPRLTEAAYRLAVHDEDPKVARLASELQKLLR